MLNTGFRPARNRLISLFFYIGHHNPHHRSPYSFSIAEGRGKIEFHIFIAPGNKKRAVRAAERQKKEKSRDQKPRCSMIKRMNKNREVESGSKKSQKSKEVICKVG